MWIRIDRMRIRIHKILSMRIRIQDNKITNLFRTIKKNIFKSVPKPKRYTTFLFSDSKNIISQKKSNRIRIHITGKIKRWRLCGPYLTWEFFSVMKKSRSFPLTCNTWTTIRQNIQLIKHNLGSLLLGHIVCCAPNIHSQVKTHSVQYKKHEKFTKWFWTMCK